MTRTVLFCAACALLLSGCPQKVTAGSTSPGVELGNLMRAAKSGDRAAFAARLSSNFDKVLSVYDRVGAARPELRGATTVDTIMNATRMSLMEPKKYLIDRDEAGVTGLHDDGSKGMVKMRFEDGMWKLDPPAELLMALNHSTDTAGTPEAAAPAPPQLESVRGNGGRFAALPPDAPAAAQAKAKALDAYDANTASDVAEQLHKASLDNPGDEELALALARVLLEQGDAVRAVAVAKSNVAAHPQSAEAYDVLGIAHMFARDYQAASITLKRALELDPAYAAQHDLKKRADLATSFATGADLSEVETGKPASQPAMTGMPHGGQH